jgi:hypothetical protein
MINITTDNYFATVKRLKKEDFPDALKDAHAMIVKGTQNGKEWDTYLRKPEAKRMVEIVFQKLSEYMKEEFLDGTSNGKKNTNPFSRIRTEIYFIKKLLSFNNSTISKKWLDIFIDELQCKINMKDITADSPAVDAIREIQKIVVDKYNQMNGSTEKLELKAETIERLNTVVEKYEQSILPQKPKDRLDGLSDTTEGNEVEVISSTDLANTEFKTIGFKDKWLAFIGDPSPGFSAMVFGMPKMGKSYLCIDFASYLAKNHGKVLYISKEEYGSPTLKKKLDDKQAASGNLDFAGSLPNNLSDYQFVFIDSVTSMKLSPADLQELKGKYPAVSFIYVFQVTKAGSARGTNEYMHNVDVVIQIPERGRAVQFGRFNQGGEMDIFSKDQSLSLSMQNNVSMLDGIKKKTMKETYPAWTTPAHLNPKDHEDLKTIYRLYKDGKLKEAMQFASMDCDTVIREEIPPQIWIKMGGQTTKSAESIVKSNQLKKEVREQLDRFREIVNTLSGEKNPNWGTVADLANLHEELGTHLIERYTEHEGYSKSVKEGIKRHSKALKSLITKLTQKISRFVNDAWTLDLIYWKDILTEWNSSYISLKKKQPYKGKDYSDDLRALKSLHEDNVGRKFSDDEFNEIFSLAILRNKAMEKHAIELNNGIMGFLMTMDQITDEWATSNK